MPCLLLLKTVLHRRYREGHYGYALIEGRRLAGDSIFCIYRNGIWRQTLALPCIWRLSPMAAAFITLWVTINKADYAAIGRGILKAPADPGVYDDDPIRWGVIATIFWGIAGMAGRADHRPAARFSCA